MTIELNRQLHDDEDTEVLARIGYRYLQFVAGKSSYALLSDDAEPLIKKYFKCGIDWGFPRLDNKDE